MATYISIILVKVLVEKTSIATLNKKTNKAVLIIGYTSLNS